jgi:cytochrome P450
MTVVAAMLLQRFELAVPEGAREPEAVLNISLRPKYPLSLTLTRRAAATTH